MAQLISALFILGLASVFIGCDRPKPNPWTEQYEPTQTPSEAIGYYSKGCLRGAQSLFPDGPGYQVMRISRRRFYGHPNLIQFITDLGNQVTKKKLGVVLVGDLSLARGGPTLSGHVSHQTGLDVDLWFWQPPQNKRLLLGERENLPAPSMLTPDGYNINLELWSKQRVELLKLTAKHPEVERILVNPVIKKAICADRKNRNWQKKVRAYWGHDDHFHVRLKCPPGNLSCVAQEPVQDDGSCDDKFEKDWFSEEARALTKQRKEKPVSPQMPELPELCQSVLQER